MAKRTAVLIDNMYLYNLAKDNGVDSLDVVKFSNSLLEDDEERYMTYVFDALPYVPRDKPTEEKIKNKDSKARYLDSLDYLDRVTVERGQVRPKYHQCKHCKGRLEIPVQKLVDVKLSVRLTELAWSRSVDRIILVCGDKDLMPAINAIDNSGVSVRLVHGKSKSTYTSKELIKACHQNKLLCKEDIEYCRMVKKEIVVKI